MTVTHVPTRLAVGDAIGAVLNARLATMSTPAKAYLRHDDAPEKGGNYVLLFLRRTDGGQYRLGGLGSTDWELTVRGIGLPANVSALLDACSGALEERTVTTAAGIETGHFRSAGYSDIRQDEDQLSLYYGDADFTFIA